MATNQKLTCPAINCDKTFSRQFNLNRHFERYHLNNDLVEKCLLCGQIFNSCKDLQTHYKTYHRPSKKFYEKESAFRKSVISYRYTFEENELDFNIAQLKILPDIKETILSETSKKTIVKCSLIYICEMTLLDHSGELITATLIPFRAPAFIANASSKNQILRNVKHSFKNQENAMEEFSNAGSNWTFNRSVAFDIEISALKPVLLGHESDSEVEKTNPNFNKPLNLRDIKNNKFLFNPNNKDQKCFLYCLFNFVKKDFNDYKHFENSLNLTNIRFPISILHIKKFMKQNKQLDFQINILYRHKDGVIYPYEYGIGNRHKDKFVNLLMVTRKIKSTVFDHFVHIKDLNKFLRDSYKNKNDNVSYAKQFYCENCLNSFSSEKIQKAHQLYCCLNKPRLEVTATRSLMKFENFRNQHPAEYIGFLDFECVLPDTSKICEICNHLRCKCDRSYTQIMTNQYPIAYSLVILDQNSKIFHEKTYVGENAADHLVEHLLEQDELWVKGLFNTYIEMNLTREEQLQFDTAEICYLCEQDFSDEVIKCRDHCHFTGNFLGAACQKCNLDRRRQNILRIFMHNGSKYDFHFIVKALTDKPGLKYVNVLPYNTENFRTVSFNSFMFLDSMSFLQSSLSQLSEDLAQTNNSYNILRQTYLVQTNDVFDRVKFKMVLGKSFFPYEYW